METFEFKIGTLTWRETRSKAPYVIMKGFKYWIVSTTQEKHGVFHELKSDRTGVIKQIAHSDLCRQVAKG